MARLRSRWLARYLIVISLLGALLLFETAMGRVLGSRALASPVSPTNDLSGAPISKVDPGNNNSPPASAILDLSGTPIPGGGNNTYQQYSVDFTATLSNTAFTFAFREDPAFLSFSNPSVTDLTIGSGNLLVNSDFSGAIYTSNGNTATPVGWVYANVYGATFGGVVAPGCGVSPAGGYGTGNCWYDGAVQAYDAITQTIATTPGHHYHVSFWLADNDQCEIDGGPPCNFSDLSTNGDTTDTRGNGINVTVYAAAALPTPAAIHVELGTDQAGPNQGMLALATAMDTSGHQVNMQDAAHAIGFDHFNWLQIIVSDRQLQACAANMALPDCASDATSTGSVPSLPTADPPPGGYAYELCPVGSPSGCQSSFPAQDYWPMYWDEYFAPVSGNNYRPSPNSPEYLMEYRQGNQLASMGNTGVSPSQALGFYFEDYAGSNFVVPGTANQAESIHFVTALVGVTGACNQLISTNCAFQIFPGTTFQWTTTNGVVSFTATPGNAPAHASPPGSHVQRKAPNNFPTNPVDLTGAQLASSIISVDQFLALANLTPQSLAAMGGGVSAFSGSLIPNQAAALAAFLSGDNTPPTCTLTGVIAGPPKQIQITVQDSDGGLAATSGGTFTAAPGPADGIQLTGVSNASVAIPVVTAGTTSPIIITATKIDQTQGASVALQVTDAAGNVTNCDPVMTDLIRDSGKPTTTTATGIAQSEHLLHIYNGSPGLSHLTIIVNGTKVYERDLGDNQHYTVDIGAWLVPGNTNTVTVVARGRQRGDATIVIADS